MPTPFEISDQYVESFAGLNPDKATVYGIAGYDDRWPDLSPAGRNADRDLHRRVADEMAAHLDHPDPDQALAARVVHGYARAMADSYDEGDFDRSLAHLYSPFEMFRDEFELMDVESAEGVQSALRRLQTVGPAYAGYRESLEVGMSRGRMSAARQVRSVIDQLRALAGDGSSYAALRNRMGPLEPDVGEAVDAAIVDAKVEAESFATWLETDYLPDAPSKDGVGRDRYQRQAERFLGMETDPDEIYRWGWEEIASLTEEMGSVGAEIQPGASLLEVRDLLETDRSRAAATVEEFVSFVERRLTDALGELDGAQFDVPEEIRTVTVNIAPAGAPPGAYYIDPSEDFRRPGSVWYSVGQKQFFPLYQEVATAYHEGFPGHHLEVGLARVKADRLSRAQRSFIWYPGFGEGWALYAERLMDELGFFELPDYRFGLLASQLFRTARVVVDIGLHLGLRIPETSPVGADEDWGRDLAVEFMRQVGMQPAAGAASEVDRYLGWPGQAISYKVGEREILAIREEVRRQSGRNFDLKRFHGAVLGGGNLPLSLLRERMLDGP